MSDTTLEKKKRKRKKKPKYLFLVQFLLKIGLIALAAYLLLTYVFGLYRMTGNQMFPSLRDGDLCILYKLEECHLDDVVLYQDEQDKLHIGRVVAVSGQSVDFPEAGGYLVNGYQPSEEITYPTYAADTKSVTYPLDVADGEYFVMNDFRSDTEDSREMGVISKSQIQGKLIFVLRRRGF